MSIYRHITTRTNYESIKTQGLLKSKSQGKEVAVWLATPSKTHWGITHVMKRHNATLDEVVVLEVTIPRAWVRRAWAGLWKCYADIAPYRLKLLGTGSDFAASPLE